MPDETQIERQETESPVLLPPRPDYWAMRRYIKRAKRFQDLIRHRENWGSDIDLAQPIEKLFPKLDKNKAARHIDGEIGKLQQVVFWDLNHIAFTNTRVKWKDRYATPDKKPREYDLILDYFRLPRIAGEEHQPFEAVMRILNNGIGVFEARRDRAFAELFNPIQWIAWFIRLPINVMERIGFGSHNKQSQEMMVGGYVKVVRFGMLAIVILTALKLGVTVPWKEIWAWVLRLL
jgi:hypothetical protein